MSLLIEAIPSLNLALQGIIVLVLLLLFVLLRRQLDKQLELTNNLSRDVQQLKGYEQANLVLVQLDSSKPARLVNLGRGSVHLLSITRHTPDAPEEPGRLIPSNPNSNILQAKWLMREGDYVELELFPEYGDGSQLKADPKNQSERQLVAKISLQVQYLYSHTGDDVMHSNFSVSLHLQKQADAGWFPHVEAKRYPASRTNNATSKTS